MEGRTLVIAKIVTLLIALAGLCVMIYGWYANGSDAPLVLSGIITGIIFAVLGFNKAKTEPDPQRDDTVEIEKDDDKSNDVGTRKEALNEH